METLQDSWGTRTLWLYENNIPVLNFNVGMSMPIQSMSNPWEWECKLFVQGFADIGPVTIVGGDGISALQTALNIIAAHLFRIGQDHDIRWFGSWGSGIETYRLYQGPDPAHSTSSDIASNLDDARASDSKSASLSSEFGWITREFEIVGEDNIGITVGISKPVKSEVHDWIWQCAVQVTGFGKLGPLFTYGADSIAAIQAAINLLDAYLFSLARDTDIRWLGSRYLGFGTYQAF